MSAPVPVGTGGPETPLNYTIWAVVCGVVAVAVLGYAVSQGAWWAAAFGGLAAFGAVGMAVKGYQLARRRRGGDAPGG